MKRRYHKYRDSGVEWIGEIPEGWSTVRAKYYFSNFAIKGKIDEPLLSVTQKNSLVRRDELENRVWNPESDISGYKLVESGDFVISLRTFEGGIELSEIRGLVSPAYTVLRRIKEFSDKFMKYLFKSEKFINELNKITTGIRQGKNISFDDFANILIPIPSLNIQEKIGSYLDHKTTLIDKLISITERKIELLKEKRTALINHAVTKGLDPNVRMKDSGIEWIGQIPEHWEVKKLKYVAKSFNGSTPKDNDDYWGDDIVWVTPGDIGKIKNQIVLLDSDRRITQEGLNSCGCTLLPPNSIILTTRAPIGNVIICGTEFTTNQGCKSLVPFNVDYIYLYYVLKTSGVVLENLGQGTTFKELSTFSLNNFYVPHPSVGEQKQIVDFLLIKNEEYEKTISTAKSTINTLKQYRQTLISEVVTGKINVEDEV